MNSTNDSIRDAMVKIKSWILLDYNKIKVELVSSNQYYASSLMVQLFIRRVVEMSLIEGCYNKVGTSFSSHTQIMQNLIDNAMTEEIQIQCVLSAIQVDFVTPRDE